MSKILWQPGYAPYATWLKTLTPEEKEAHLAKRREKKSMKKAMQATVESQQEQWITLFNNTAAALMKRAIENGDVSAFTAVYDRFVGKPESQMDITSNGSTMTAPIIVFEAEELDEWKDEAKKK